MFHSLDFSPPSCLCTGGICTFSREKYTPPNRLLFVGTPPVAVGSSGSWPRLSFQRAPTTGGGGQIPAVPTRVLSKPLLFPLGC